jgi:uncharacterized protein (TIGR01244 family)
MKMGIRRALMRMGCAVVLVLAGCAHAPAPSVAWQQPLPGLYTSGQPAASDWQAFKALGVRTVIDLRAPGERTDRDEAAEVQAAGLRYVQIPVKGEAGLTDENVRRLHQALAPSHAGVLVHCASGNRAGALLALEQAQQDGLPAAQALALGKAAGLTHLEPAVRKALGLAPVEGE